MVQKSASTTAATTPGWVLLLPFFLLVGMLFFSPNFRWQQGEDRETPYGADYLQDWIGGSIVLSSDRQRLYDLEFVKELQHDPAKIGFTWPAEKYFPMVYPPFHYVLVSPLSLLPYRWAVILWSVLSILAFCATAWLLVRYQQTVAARFPLCFGAMIFFVPWIKCLSMGQKSTLLLLLFTGTFLLLQRGRNFQAGLVFGLVAIKPQLGLVIGAVMLIKRQWSFACGAVSTIGLLSGISWLIQPTWWPDYVGIVSKMGHYLDTGGYQLSDSHSFWGGLKLLLPQLDSHWVNVLTLIISLALLSLVLWTLRGKWEPNNHIFAQQFSMLVFTTVLLSPHTYTYDLTILLLPIVLILAHSDFRPKTWRARGLLGLTVLLYVFAGGFPELANTIGFQPNLLVIGGLVILLSNRERES